MRSLGFMQKTERPKQIQQRESFPKGAVQTFWSEAKQFKRLSSQREWDGVKRSIDQTKTEIKSKIANEISELVEAVDFQSDLEEFDETLAENKDKKSFVGGLVKIFTTLLATKCSSIKKLKRIIKISAQL